MTRIPVAERPPTPKSTHSAMKFTGDNLMDIAWFCGQGDKNFTNLRVFVNGYVEIDKGHGIMVQFRKGEYLLRDRETCDITAMSEDSFKRKYMQVEGVE